MRITEIIAPDPRQGELPLPAGQTGQRPIPSRLRTLKPQVWQTPEFRAWFRGSKIVDRTGRPLQVYHGTTAPEDFTQFAVGDDVSHEEDDYYRTGSGADPRTYLGSHFAREPQVANKFARGLYGERQGEEAGGRVMPVYLRIIKPYMTSDSQMMTQILAGNYTHDIIEQAIEREAHWESITFDDMVEQYEKNAKVREHINDEALSISVQEAEPPDLSLAREMADQYRNNLIRRGYDGIIYKNEVEGGTSYIVFDPRQVKSAFASEFNPESPHISETAHAV